MKTLQIYLSLLFYITCFPTNVFCQKNNTSKIVPEDEAIQAIRDFYVTYTNNMLSEISSNDSLVSEFLTMELIKKVDRMRTAIGSDPIIRAQDFREDVIKTFTIKHLDENWYMVSYDWDVNNDINHTEIPLRVTSKNGHCMIDYITPEWNGTLYGDNLLCDDYREQQKIDDSTPLSLLQTFYKLYTTIYSKMQDDLNNKIAGLRSEYLTNNALSQFDKAANEYIQDGYKGYDLLIDYFDFDCMWLPSVKFVQLDENIYQMYYTKWDVVTNITLKVIKQDKKYRIDNISVKI